MAAEADTAAYSGRLGTARELTRRAVASAENAQDKEGAASHEISAAVRETLFGNLVEARQRVASAFGLSKGQDVQYRAAFALALGSDTVQAKALTGYLDKESREPTLSQFNSLQTLKAQLAVNAHDSAKAIELLRTIAPYELACLIQQG